MNGRNHLGYLGIDGRIILKWILKKQVVDWIQLAQDRVQWQALGTMVMNLGFHKRQGLS
jgi:urocanate hydratase